jgi:hypothetical protein
MGAIFVDTVMMVEGLGRGRRQATKLTERSLSETLTPEGKSELVEHLARDL